MSLDIRDFYQEINVLIVGRLPGIAHVNSPIFSSISGNSQNSDLSLMSVLSLFAIRRAKILVVWQLYFHFTQKLSRLASISKTMFVLRCF